jgi:integrase
MTRVDTRQRRPRGLIDKLPSGRLRVRVYTGYDPVTKRRHYISATVPVGRNEQETLREAEKVRTRLVNQVDERRNPRTRATMNQLLDRWLDVIKVEKTTRHGYVGKIDKHIRPTIGALPVGRLDAEVIESLYAQLRTCSERCGGRRYIEHRTSGPHECDDHPREPCRPARPESCQACARRCQQHECRALSDGSIRVIHSILKGTLRRAVRWSWIAVNPMAFVESPRIPPPDPNPPSPDEAARIVNDTWNDPDWGALVWLAMMVGPRRGEVSALRWSDLELDSPSPVVTLRRSIGQHGGQVWEKDTKTHQRRRVSLDEYTVGILREHRTRSKDRAAALHLTLPKDGFVFSLAPDCSTPLRPDTVTQKYGRLAKRLGVQTHFHALRHYSATELIAAGVDVRTVAGRLGHGGGGATTLRVYSAWVAESDQRAAAVLASRMPRPPTHAGVREGQLPSGSLCEAIAAELRTTIAGGVIASGESLPSVKEVAAKHGVSYGTAQRALAQLKASGLIEVVRGHRARVR